MGTQSLTDPLDLKLAMKLSQNHFWSATNRQMYVRNLDLGGWGEWQLACFLLYNFWLTLICKIFLYLLPWAEMYRCFLVWFQSKLLLLIKQLMKTWMAQKFQPVSSFTMPILMMRSISIFARCYTLVQLKIIARQAHKMFQLERQRNHLFRRLLLRISKTVWRHWQRCTAVLQGIVIHVSHLGLTRGIQQIHDLWYVISMTTLFTCWFAISSLQQQQNSLTQT